MSETEVLVRQKAQAAHDAAVRMGILTSGVKNKALLAMADALLDHSEAILKANEEDMLKAQNNGMKSSMQDRLRLTPSRIESMAEGLRLVAQLKDPVGEVIGGSTLSNGLSITKVRVPIGVVGIIYEARPNVTADAIGLCLKSGNTVVLKGGSEALRSNQTIAEILSEAAQKEGIPSGAIQFIDVTDRQAVTDLIHMNGLVDVVIPRGSARLIQAVVQNATVPVIETGAGVCHTFVDESANCEMARQIAFNAKVQRPSVCNAMETLLVHEKIADAFLPQMIEEFIEAGVTLFGCEKTCQFDPRIQLASSEDWATEYGDLRLSVKIVRDIDEALAHIARFSTRHSECIVTENMNNARRFQSEVDAAVVYVNASTRFTDGFEFGFGAEIGISTQKLHARGPMALPELTSYKYLVTGNGQIRG
ncbi:MAG TPA: glutamate-5-semialdehyde dehydrogenase [Candidatus Aphodousia faecigallinarum]|uniref:Gamma-glutamyl phosphate reductase n=1 Tax=Candidatus Aphodousia faecigallinarum TaxID=2840677 RepID=A0A9D1IIN1_9BURK|nr:glutamate-5-semialdehyde dehydrogenase [Candidatus Aphodousia faecigallinarum]